MAKLRNTIIKMLSIVFAFCTAFAIATMPTPAKAETDNFSTVQDASIRNEEDGIIGLKFQSTVNNAWLQANSAEKYTFGTLIYPASNDSSFVDGKYKTRIYETETMKEDSFVEVVSFDYEIPPLTFDKAGDDFYVSMGGKKYTTSAKNGITLKVSVE